MRKTTPGACPVSSRSRKPKKDKSVDVESKKEQKSSNQPEEDFGDSKPASSFIVPKKEELLNKPKNDISDANMEVSGRISIRNLPIEERRAYFAKKKRESDARILATEEGRLRRKEAAKPLKSKYDKKGGAKYYQSILADPEKHKALKERLAKNQRIRRARERTVAIRPHGKEFSPV